MKYEVHIHRHGCPICGCVSSLPYKDTRWCECLSCGLVYLDRFSRLPEVDDLLHGRQHHFFEDKKIEDFKERFDVKRKGFENRLNLYLQFVNFHDKNLKVCEVGFGGGILLKLLLERGYTNVYGIEVVERYCQHARGIGVPTFWADLSNQSQSHLVINHAFDLVIGNEMMEHVESPVDFMKGVRRITKEGGHAVFSFAVPDGRKRLSGSEWQYARESSIKKLVELSGWNMEHFKISSTTAFAWLVK